MSGSNAANYVDLIELGTQVNINIKEFNDHIPKEFIEKIEKDPKGIVVDYKMTDGNGIGIIIKREDGLRIWLFNNEIKEYKEKEKEKEKDNKNLLFELRNTIIGGFDISSNKSISNISNPFNFIKWILYATKDIV